MAYNHGREDRKWRIWKEAEEKLLRECGVDEATIEQIRMADRADFNSNRRFYRWTNDVAEYLEDMAGRERQAEVGTVAELLEEIESENLYPLMISDYFQGTACEASSVELLYSAGMMIGTFVINHFGNKLQHNAACAAFIGLFGLGSTTLISGFLPKSDAAFWIFAFMCFGMGISAVFYNILYIAYMQETISSKYHGRAFSLLNSIISLTMPLDLLVAGPVFCLIGSDPKTK